MVTAPPVYLAAGRQSGTASNHDLQCIRQQLRHSFVWAQKPSFKPKWQIDCTETRQAAGVGGLKTVEPTFELEIEAGRGIDHPGAKFWTQLRQVLLLDETTLRPVLPAAAQPAAPTDAAKSVGGTTVDVASKRKRD